MRRALVVAALATASAAGACNQLTGLNDFEKVYCSVDCGFIEDGGDAGDAAEPIDGASDDGGPPVGDGGPRAWARWKMPNAPEDNTLPNPAAYQDDKTNGVVVDRVTGLHWQRDDSGGFDQGDFGSARAFCAMLNAEGASDWTVPTRIELMSLLDYKGQPATIAMTYPGSALAAPYWTSSAVAASAGTYFTVSFSTALVTSSPVGPARVRCVRGAGAVGSSVSAPVDQYDPFNAGSQTISDRQTGLTWQRFVSDRLTFAQASAYCGSLDAGAAWRVPSMKELATIVAEVPHQEYENGMVVTKAIDQQAFPDTPAELFWSASAITSQVVVVDFSSGEVTHLGPANAARTRCVR